MTCSSFAVPSIRLIVDDSSLSQLARLARHKHTLTHTNKGKRKLIEINGPDPALLLKSKTEFERRLHSLIFYQSLEHKPTPESYLNHLLEATEKINFTSITGKHPRKLVARHFRYHRGGQTFWTAGHFQKFGRRRGPHHLICSLSCRYVL